MDAERAIDADDERAGCPASSEPLRDRVAAVMERIVAGERSAVWDLHELAEPSISRMLRGEARRIDVHISGDDLFDLTLDAAVDLGRLAPAWKPDGALPWVWARHRIAALVHDHVGTFARDLDESHLEIEARPALPRIDDPRAALRSLAQSHPAARRLDQRLSVAASERDADIWLGVQIEKAAGNRSPAVTVGVDHGLRPEAVRKVVQRVGERLADVA
ncbi:MAG: hypothetical protein ACOYXM_15970 [Actinomycetota bacterium]